MLAPDPLSQGETRAVGGGRGGGAAAPLKGAAALFSDISIIIIIGSRVNTTIGLLKMVYPCYYYFFLARAALHLCVFWVPCGCSLVFVGKPATIFKGRLGSTINACVEWI